jgi:hypothetical protein
MSRKCWILLLALTVGFYWKLTLSGQYIWYDHPDMAYIELPRMSFQAFEIQKRHFPLWDPYIWCGQSLVGQTQPGPLFPLNLLFYLLPLEDGYLRQSFLNWYYVGIHFLAAWFCYLLCIELGTGKAAGVLAGMTFTAGGFMGTVPWLDVVNGGIWAPLILRYAVRSARGQSRYSNAALAGMFLGFAWLSGHHELPLLVSLATGGVWAYFAWRERGLWKAAALFLLSTGMVSAVQVWPTAEFGRLSKRWVGVEIPVGWNDQVPYTVHTIYSLPAKGLVETLFPGAASYGDVRPFLGAAAVFLAVLGGVLLWRERQDRWVAVLALVSAVYALGAVSPLHGVMYSIVPVLGKARLPVRALLLYNLAAAVLAAFGLEALIKKRSEKWIRRIAIAAGLWGAFVLAGSTWRMILGYALEDRVWLNGICACAAAAVFLAVQKGVLGPRSAPAILLGLALTELTPLSTGAFPHVREGGQVKFAGLLARDRDIAEFLRGRQGVQRVVVNDSDIPANFGDWHRIEMLQGYVAGVPENLRRQGLHTERIRQLAGVTHYIGRKPESPEQVELYTGGSGVKVYSNPGAMPRAWVVHEVEQEPAFWRLALKMQKAGFDFRKRALVEGPAPKLEECNGTEDLKMVRRNTDRITVEAELGCRGLLILNDAYYPGWRVKVDGKPGEVIEVYGFLRGVVVEGGRHTIDMIYRPVSIVGGACLTLGGLLLVAAVWVGERLRRAVPIFF